VLVLNGDTVVPATTTTATVGADDDGVAAAPALSPMEELKGLGGADQSETTGALALAAVMDVLRQMVAVSVAEETARAAGEPEEGGQISAKGGGSVGAAGAAAVGALFVDLLRSHGVSEKKYSAAGGGQHAQELEHRREWGRQQQREGRLRLLLAMIEADAEAEADEAGENTSASGSAGFAMVCIGHSGPQLLQCLLQILNAAAVATTGVSKEASSRRGGDGGLDEAGGGSDEGAVASMEIVVVVLGILTAILELGAVQRSKKEEAILRLMLGPLETLSSYTIDSGGSSSGAGNASGSGAIGTEGDDGNESLSTCVVVAEMSTVVRCALLTRGYQQHQHREQTQQAQKQAKPPTQEQQGSTQGSTPDTATATPDTAVGAAAVVSAAPVDSSPAALLHSARVDLQSPLVPLRARAIVKLRKALDRTTSAMLDSRNRGNNDINNNNKPGGIVELGTPEGETDSGDGVRGENGKWQAWEKLVPQLLRMFVRCLDDQESFVYLAGVQAVASLVNSFPAIVLPPLARAFCGELMGHIGAEGEGDGDGDGGAGSASGSGNTTHQQRSMQIIRRTKIGEALLFGARRCGLGEGLRGTGISSSGGLQDCAPLFVHAFLQGAREAANMPQYNSNPSAASGAKAAEETAREDEMMVQYRAGCMSNLAEVMALLRWGARPYLTDVVDLVDAVLQLEQAETGSTGPIVTISSSISSASDSTPDGSLQEEQEEQEGGQRQQPSSAPACSRYLLRRGATYLLLRILCGCLDPTNGINHGDDVQQVIQRATSNGPNHTWAASGDTRLSSSAQAVGEVLQHLLGPHMKRIYRLLKQSAADPNDSVTRHHASQALELLDGVMRSQLRLRSGGGRSAEQGPPQIEVIGD
jgi:hypothetical protein